MRDRYALACYSLVTQQWRRLVVTRTEGFRFLQRAPRTVHDLSHTAWFIFAHCVSVRVLYSEMSADILHEFFGWWPRDVRVNGETAESSSNPRTPTVGINVIQFWVLREYGKTDAQTSAKLNFYSSEGGRLLQNWDSDKWCYNIDITPSLYSRGPTTYFPHRGRLVFLCCLKCINQSRRRMG
jgi:hypothetical protein